MKKYYFFETPKGIVDYDESTAYLMMQMKNLKYIGWSDGALVEEAKKTPRIFKKDETGRPIQIEDSEKKILLDAYAAEVEKARLNTQPPPDLSRRDIGGGPPKN